MKVTFYDHGLNTELAVSFATAGHDVAYFSPWDETSPKSAKALIGYGLEGVTRIEDFDKAAERSEFLVFPDTFNGARAEYWRRQGKSVWSAGYAERLEEDRAYMNGLQKSLGIATPQRQIVKGVAALDEALRKCKDKYVKVSKFRGDKETFHHEDYSRTRTQFLGNMWRDFGDNPTLEFIIEDPIPDAVEVGNDDIFQMGRYMSPGMVGYEAKDKAYLGHVCDQPPAFMAELRDSLRMTLRSYNVQSFVSYEMRVVPGPKAYLIDPTLRCAHPVLSGMLANYMNISDVLIKGTPPKAASPYVAIIVIESDWADDHWTEVQFDPEWRKYVKLKRACRVEGRYFALPGFSVVCECVGIGSTAEAAVTMAKKVVEQVKVTSAQYDCSALDDLLNSTVPKGKKLGISF